MWNNPVEIKTETTSVLCDADVGVHGAGLTVPNVLRSDFNLFVHSYIISKVLGFVYSTCSVVKTFLSS